MSTDPKTIAQALVELAKAIPAEDFGKACDAAIGMMDQSGSVDLKAFPGRVLSALEQHEGVLFASIATPTGSVGDQHETIVKDLEKAFGKKVQLSERADPTLIGGAVLRVGDEMYDVSILGQIHRLVDHFLTGRFNPAANS